MLFGVDEILLHRPPMQLIDRLVDCSERSAAAEMTFSEDGYGVENGTVSEPALLECMAQTMAAHQGQRALEQGIEPVLGMLVGLKDVIFHQSVGWGVRLDIRVDITHNVGSFYLADCSVARDSVEVASGTLKFFVPEEGE